MCVDCRIIHVTANCVSDKIMHLRFSTECTTSNILRVTDTSSVPMAVSVVLGVIIALLVVVIISLSIAIHRLRRALQQQKSATRSAGSSQVPR